MKKNIIKKKVRYGTVPYGTVQNYYSTSTVTANTDPKLPEVVYVRTNILFVGCCETSRKNITGIKINTIIVIDALPYRVP